MMNKKHQYQLKNLRSANVFKDTREYLEQIEQLRMSGSFDKAERMCAQLLSDFPEYYAALHTMGLIQADRGNLRKASEYLFNAATVNPKNVNTLLALASVCLQRGSNEMAATLIEQARGSRPSDPLATFMLADLYDREREFEAAIEMHLQVCKLDPNFEENWIRLAHAYNSIGDYKSSISAIDPLIRANKLSQQLLLVASAWPSNAANLNILDALDKMKALPLPRGEVAATFENRNKFIKATGLHRAQRYTEAWKTLIEANNFVYNANKSAARDIGETEAAALKILQTTAVNNNSEVTEGPFLLFILGASRSGKTTVESILAGCDGVKRGFENPGLITVIRRIFADKGLLTSWTLDKLPPQFFPDFKRMYLEDSRQRAGQAKVFTNTTPIHMHHAKYLAQIIPNVRFICVRRNREDNLLRILMRMYEQGNYHSYNVKAIAAHLDWYSSMIDLLQEKFPNIVRTINYEDLVQRPEIVPQAASELCGIPIGSEGLQTVGDDRGVSAPYLDLIAAAIKQ